MALTSGTCLGANEMLAPLGAGGMGEVYRARDLRLKRDVAIKVLPSSLPSSQQVRQRFEREPKTISSLSHPPICTLYDVRNQAGTEDPVMEYRLCPFFGPTLFSSLAAEALLVRPHRDGGEAQ